jgi:hypothetical protein
MAINQIEYKYLLLPFVVTSMQLLEYFAWENINNKQTIALLSLFGLSLILLQLLIINLKNNFQLVANEEASLKDYNFDILMIFKTFHKICYIINKIYPYPLGKDTILFNIYCTY